MYTRIWFTERMHLQQQGNLVQKSRKWVIILVRSLCIFACTRLEFIVHLHVVPVAEVVRPEAIKGVHLLALARPLALSVLQCSFLKCSHQNLDMSVGNIVHMLLHAYGSRSKNISTLQIERT